MKYTISAAQGSFQSGAVDTNLSKMETIVKSVLEKKPDTKVITFPELCTTGYFLSEGIKDLAEKVDGPIFQAIKTMAVSNLVSIVYGYVEIDNEGNVYNSIQYIDANGKNTANYRKIHLTPLERGVFTAGSEPVTVKTDFGTIGLMICWDLAFPELARMLTLNGADILLVPSAWEEPYDAPFLQFSGARALDNSVYLIASNHTGKSEDLTFFGKSSIFAPNGQVVATAEKQYDMITATIDYDWRNEIKQSFFSMLEERRTDIYS
ncbi:carbon-nitrogen hydrolase family protein [Guptibacillus sedimenti]|uniref:carbon-nitrogen hydrolase family protein n=1 Tax=Guptibacillus sedimenti TaxID=3025680 RepID=UPI00235F8D0F|nr:carbon-nitrogen hydrolase family protein [Pseudalkalibacillus sedimenti]